MAPVFLNYHCNPGLLSLLSRNITHCCGSVCVAANSDKPCKIKNFKQKTFTKASRKLIVNFTMLNATLRPKIEKNWAMQRVTVALTPNGNPGDGRASTSRNSVNSVLKLQQSRCTLSGAWSFDQSLLEYSFSLALFPVSSFFSLLFLSLSFFFFS